MRSTIFDKFNVRMLYEIRAVLNVFESEGVTDVIRMTSILEDELRKKQSVAYKEDRDNPEHIKVLRDRKRATLRERKEQIEFIRKMPLCTAINIKGKICYTKMTIAQQSDTDEKGNKFGLDEYEFTCPKCRNSVFIGTREDLQKYLEKP